MFFNESCTTQSQHDAVGESWGRQFKADGWEWKCFFEQNVFSDDEIEIETGGWEELNSYKARGRMCGFKNIF
jgi:hypothetical protein